jgi:hypothetical protein
MNQPDARVTLMAMSQPMQYVMLCYRQPALVILGLSLELQIQSGRAQADHNS